MPTFIQMMQIPLDVAKTCEIISTFLFRIISPYRSASCIDAPAAWWTRNFHTLRSFAATSASSTDHPKSILLMSLFMVSFHAVLGRPRRLLPWVGFQECSLLGMREASMRCTWPNHFKRFFLMTDVSWGCLVLDLMLSFAICWNQTIFRIFLWHLMSNASSLASSLSVRVQHSAAYKSVESTQAL